LGIVCYWFIIIYHIISYIYCYISCNKLKKEKMKKIIILLGLILLINSISGISENQTRSKKLYYRWTGPYNAGGGSQFEVGGSGAGYLRSYLLFDNLSGITDATNVLLCVNKTVDIVLNLTELNIYYVNDTGSWYGAGAPTEPPDSIIDLTYDTVEGLIINRTVCDDITDVFNSKEHSNLTIKVNASVDTTGIIRLNRDGVEPYLIIERISYSLSGYIYDGELSTPIFLSAIQLYQGGTLQYTNITGEDGYFDIPDVLIGHYNYTISAEGYPSYNGTIYIAGDTILNTYLYLPNSTNIFSVDITFLDKDLLGVSNVGVTFEYIEGAECAIGTQYLYFTNSFGKVNSTLPLGTYAIRLNTYQIREYIIDEWSWEVYLMVNHDLTRTYLVRQIGNIYNTSIIVLNGSNGEELNGSLVYLSNEFITYTGTSGEDGNGQVDFLTTIGIYDLTVNAQHLGFQLYPSPIISGFEISEINVTMNETYYVILTLESSNIYNLTVIVYDINNNPIENVTIHLSGDGAYTRYGDFFFDNLTDTNGTANFTDIPLGNYEIYANKTGYEDSQIFFESISTNYYLIIQLLNITQVTDLNITVNESNDLSNIFCRLEDITYNCNYGDRGCLNQDNQVRYTNLSGIALFSGIHEYHHYEIEFIKNGYQTFTQIFRINNTNITYHFTMPEINYTSDFHGFIYFRPSVGGLRGINNAILTLISSDNITYTSISNPHPINNADGYFIFENLDRELYTLNITKTGFVDRGNIRVDLRYGNLLNDYFLEGDNIRAVRITVFWRNENDTFMISRLENAKIKMYEDLQEDSAFYFSTNPQGEANEFMPSGSYNIEISKDGYTTITDKIIITNINEEYEFTMIKEDIRPDDIRDYISINQRTFFSFIINYGWIIILIIIGLVALSTMLMSLADIKESLNKIGFGISMIIIMIIIFTIILLL